MHSHHQQQNRLELGKVLGIYIERDNLHVLTIYLENGAATTHKDTAGNTPLHLAAQHGNPQIVALLLKYNADRKVINNNGASAISVAAASKHWTCVYEFARTNAEGDPIYPDEDSLCQYNVALTAAVEDSQLWLVKALLNAKAKPDYPRPEKDKTPEYYPLHIAVELNYPPMVALLLLFNADYKATPNQDHKDTSQKKDYLTPIYLAAELYQKCSKKVNKRPTLELQRRELCSTIISYLPTNPKLELLYMQSCLIWELDVYLNTPDSFSLRGNNKSHAQVLRKACLKMPSIEDLANLLNTIVLPLQSETDTLPDIAENKQVSTPPIHSSLPKLFKITIEDAFVPIIESFRKQLHELKDKPLKPPREEKERRAYRLRSILGSASDFSEAEMPGSVALTESTLISSSSSSSSSSASSSMKISVEGSEIVVEKRNTKNQRDSVSASQLSNVSVVKAKKPAQKNDDSLKKPLLSSFTRLVGSS